MGGQRCYKHVKEIGGKMQLDKYKKRNLKAKKDMSIFVKIVAVCVEVKACRSL
jgi:hypothetical protein